jgi:putative CocE/NonD family hydrolase
MMGTTYIGATWKFRNFDASRVIAAAWLVVLCVCASAPAAFAQQLDFPAGAADGSAARDKAIPGLAKQAIAQYREEDRTKYLDTLFRLQMAAEDYSGASATLKSLRDARGVKEPDHSSVTDAQYEVFLNAKLLQSERALPFADAFAQSFRQAYAKFDDKTALRVSDSFVYGLNHARDECEKSFKQLKESKSIQIADAIDLLKKYQPYQVSENVATLIRPLMREDDNKRYLIQNDVLIRTNEGATIWAQVVRQRTATTPQPTALVFTIYAEPDNLYSAKLGAAHGYVGMTAYTRGKGLSPDAVEPYEHEAQDAYSIIEWISKQPWSDGQVGMYGGSYNGFTQWAATKRLHPALKTIVPYVAAIPGLGLPMENNVFLNANYGWAFYVADNKYLDNKTYSDPNRWRSLDDKWYASGRPYRELDRVDGAPNKWLQRWLAHPAYDKYWQDMTPYKGEFASINIPVLTITGYYDDGQISALQYLKEPYRYNKNANHYLLIGPYDHFGAQSSRKEPILKGYSIDPVAQIDTPEITFQWLDYVMRGGAKPDLLKDKINYEVMGSNEWKHAPSLERMSNDSLVLYLTDEKAGSQYRLSQEKPSKPGFLYQEVDFADRKTRNNDYYPSRIVGKVPNLSNGFSFISEPFNEPVSIDGTFSGVIKATINKKDMDIGVVLYEVMPNGELFHLCYFLGRASYAEDMSVRRLLTPGAVESIPFERTRMVSRQLSKGSRLLVTLNVNKSQFCQINYGTGKDVSDEDINDAKTPLQVKWLNDSYVKIPIWK